jgi:hypothetical protein
VECDVAKKLGQFFGARLNRQDNCIAGIEFTAKSGEKGGMRAPVRSVSPSKFVGLQREKIQREKIQQEKARRGRGKLEKSEAKNSAGKKHKSRKKLHRRKTDLGKVDASAQPDSTIRGRSTT